MSDNNQLIPCNICNKTPKIYNFKDVERDDVTYDVIWPCQCKKTAGLKANYNIQDQILLWNNSNREFEKARTF